ncbi:DUF397 domain-containing protein [Streptomyces sp. DT195]|uniref:DUF397 domain-containing protein n=1 Tax=Streptomyces sp. DT195 TaxID=3393419 RepID=UPI003CE7416E
MFMTLPLSGWHKSSYSTERDDACVEAATLMGGGILVRDSKDRARCPLTASPTAWGTFLALVSPHGSQPGPTPTSR